MKTTFDTVNKNINITITGNNAFTYQQLTEVVARFQSDSKDREEEIREAFRVFDRDGNGYEIIYLF